MVQRRQQGPPRPAPAKEAGAEERPLRQVEGGHRFRRGERVGRFGRAGVLHRQRERSGGDDRLHGATLPVGEHGPQRLVAVNQRLQRTPHRLGIDRTLQLQPERHRVQARGPDQAVQEPHPLLRERDGERGSVRDAPGRRTLLRARVPELVDARGQVAEHRGLEDGADGKLDAQPPPHPRQELHGTERMPPQREEAVAPAGRPGAEQLGPDPGQRALGRGFGRRRTIEGDDRGGERAAVHLPARGEGERVQPGDARRDQRRGKLAGEGGAKRLG